MTRPPGGILTRLTDLGRTAAYFAARGPGSTQAYLRWRSRRLLDRMAPRSFEVDPSDMASLLASRIPASALPTGEAATGAVAAHFRDRSTPRFRFDEADRETIIGLVSAADRSRTLAEATAIEGGRFEFRGMAPVQLASPIDWRQTPEGNLDWRWDLNRHRYLETLGRAYWYDGDERHADAVRRLLADWTASNPAITGQPNWSSVFEVAVRIDSWLAVFHLVRRSSSLDDAAILTLVAGLLSHGRFLAANLELHVPNNHLLLEAKALVALGILMPELPDADAWRARGQRVLDRELRRQVCPDGGHAERTPLYHRMVTGELLELAVLHEANGLTVPGSLRQVLPAMIDFEVAMTRPDGSLSLFSDSVQDDSGVRFSPATAGPAWLARTAAVGRSQARDRVGGEAVDGTVSESDAWLLGSRAGGGTAPVPASRAFPVTGYATMRSGSRAAGDESLLVFDCGPFGYRSMPTHGHADALSFELYAAGRLWITDAGGYNLHLGPAWRAYFRSTRAHNTVVVDEADQSVLLDGRRVYRPAEAVLRRWMSTLDAELAEADHDGYLRLGSPVEHARSVVALRDGAWLIVDDLRGSGRHGIDVLFHLPADLSVTVDAGTGVARAADPSGRGALAIVPSDAAGWTLDVIRGATEPPQGWVSVESGRREPAAVVRYRCQAALPLRIAFLLAVGPLDAPVPRLRLAEGSADALTLRAERGSEIAEVTIDHGGVHVERATAEGSAT